MTGLARIGILGGTLDPIHRGHVGAALAARDALALDEVRVLPSHVPPHRPQQPVASPFHRFAMAALAVGPLPGMVASDDELRAPGPSYTADTLRRLADSGLDRTQIFFITGADAFAEIATWRCYPEVLDLAHFVVVSRPDFPVSTLHGRLPALASRLRDARAPGDAGASPSILLLNTATPDVSSTDLRDRLRTGLPVTGLVPAAVEAHIRRHGLYRSAAPAVELHGQD